MKKLRILLKALKYVIRKKHNALDWNGVLYDETKTAYESGQIQQKYQTSFNDLLLKYSIESSQDEIKIPVKWELGSISDLETNFICKIAIGMKAKNIFEIGTYLGKTAVNLAYNTEKDVKIFTLDLPQKDREFMVGKYIKEHREVSNKIIQLFEDSKNFDFSPYFNKIDLMFIDGNHIYEYVLNDGKKALKCVRKGGFIIWHDFDYRHLGSSKAIIEICKENMLELNKISITPLAITKV